MTGFIDVWRGKIYLRLAPIYIPGRKVALEKILHQLVPIPTREAFEELTPEELIGGLIASHAYRAVAHRHVNERMTSPQTDFTTWVLGPAKNEKGEFNSWFKKDPYAESLRLFVHHSSCGINHLEMRMCWNDAYKHCEPLIKNKKHVSPKLEESARKFLQTVLREPCGGTNAVEKVLMATANPYWKAPNFLIKELTSYGAMAYKGLKPYPDTSSIKKNLKTTNAQFLAWVSEHYGPEYGRDCKQLLAGRPGDEVLNPDAILDQVFAKHQPQVRYNGKRFGAMRTSSH